MSEASAPANIPVAVASAMVVGPSVPIKRERRANVRLPQDIRSQLGVRVSGRQVVGCALRVYGSQYFHRRQV